MWGRGRMKDEEQVKEKSLIKNRYYPATVHNIKLHTFTHQQLKLKMKDMSITRLQQHCFNESL